MKYNLFIVLIFFSSISFSKDSFTVSGIVQNSDGSSVKTGSIILLNKSDGTEVKKSKINKKGKFKLKKIQPGKYQIDAITDLKQSVNINVVDEDIKDLIITINPAKQMTESRESSNQQTNDDIQIISKPVQTLNTPLKTKNNTDLLPQVKPFEKIERLQFEDQFFEYESNLRLLKSQVDSLKNIVIAFEKKQTMPNVSREILNLIKAPEFQYRIELKNGTVVLGDILSETDSSLTLKTQIGQLVLEKEMVIRKDKHEEPEPNVIFLGDPFVNIYPDRHEFSGRIKNVGEKRADFVRIITNLYTQTTKLAGQDSVFVKGSRVIYDSGVIADTALEPDQTATYSFPVKINGGKKVQYHTMDIHWNTTD